MSSDTTLFLLSVTIIVVILYWYFYYYIDNTPNEKLNNEVKHDKIVERVKRAIGKSHSLLSSEEEEIEKYKLNEKDSLFDKEAETWTSDNAKVRDLCRLGFKLLEIYAIDNKPEKYLDIATDIVLRISQIVNKLLEINVIHASKVKPKQKKRDISSSFSNASTEDENEEDSVDAPRHIKPRHQNEASKVKLVIDRYTFSVYIPRLMMEYEFIGKNDCIKEHVCHPIITKLIHSLNASLDKVEDSSKMITYGLPRLLTNYLFDQTTYLKEIDSDLYKKLKNFYFIQYNPSEELKVGIYEDGSCIDYDNVAKFSWLYTLGGIYGDLYTSLETDNNFDHVVEPIMKKLMHPTISYATFGLYDHDGVRKRKDWGDVKGELGIVIMPYIGLGIFKTERFMFSLRIQRPQIAAYYKPASDSTNEFALGWIQLRKMYVAGFNYPETLTWASISDEPGIITDKNNINPDALKPTDEHSLTILPENVNSLIGRLPNENLMFWMNQYQFPQYYGANVTITEMGVATDNGVEILYYTNENNSDKALQIRVKDNDNSNLHIEPNESDGFADLNSDGVTLRMLFSDTTKIQIKKNNENNGMNFEYKGKVYTIRVAEEEENQKYIVYVSDVNEIILNEQIAFGGSSKSELNDTMTISSNNTNKVLVRSKTSLMYIPE